MYELHYATFNGYLDRSHQMAPKLVLKNSIEILIIPPIFIRMLLTLYIANGSQISMLDCNPFDLTDNDKIFGNLKTFSLSGVDEENYITALKVINSPNESFLVV